MSLACSRMTVSLLGSSTQSNRRGITSRYCGGWVGPPPAVGDVSNRADDRFVAPGEHLWFVVLLGNGTCEIGRPTGAAVATGIQNSLGLAMLWVTGRHGPIHMHRQFRSSKLIRGPVGSHIRVR